MTGSNRIYGARHSATPIAGTASLSLPVKSTSVDLRAIAGVVRYQNGNQCVGEMMACLHHIATGGDDYASELGIWTAARALERSRSTDPIPNVGCMPSDAIAGMINQGIYKRNSRDDDESQDTTVSNVEEIVEALAHRCSPSDFLPIAVGDTDTVKRVLSMGHGVGFIMQVDKVYEDLAGANNTYIAQSDSPLGGHAQVVVGYTEDDHFIIKNSWGDSWGEYGYCYIPVKVFAGLAYELVAMVSGPSL